MALQSCFKISDIHGHVGNYRYHDDREIQGFPKIIYYMRHFQAKHNIDPKYLQVLDPDLTEYGLQQGFNITFDNELDLIICSPLSRTIQTYLSLFHDIEKRQRIPFMLDTDLQEIGEIPADTASSKAQLKQKFPQLSSIIDRDLAEDFNDKKNPLYSSSSNSVKQRIIRFHQRLWTQRNEKHIMIITHAGWLSRALDQKELKNGEIVKQIYKNGVV
ncbi:unnamed protein product [Adineta steineri]|uniref:Phosphoglycerate mutase-like protein n=1 Tax=Adineta steineri TaxID=433720 RepID=A0A813V9N4_9BILA|nr:unnamed protein product [Adineta steineri]